MSFGGLTTTEFVLLFSGFGLALSLLTLLGMRLRAAAVATLPLWRLLGRRQRTSLRRVLTLLLQLTIILLLALAVADPRPPATAAPPGWQLLVLVDTSASMAAGHPESRLQQAAELVAWLSGQARNRDRFLLLEFAAQPRWHYGPGPAGPALVQAARRLRVREEADNVASAWKLIERWLAIRPADAPPARLLLLSDRFHQVPEHLATLTWQVALDGTRDNLAVSQFEIFPAADGRQLQAQLRVDNFTARHRRVQLVLHTEKLLLGRNRLELAPGASRWVRLLLPAPPRPAVMATLVSNDEHLLDALVADDRAYALAPRLRERRLLLAGTRNLFLQLALELQPGVRLQVQAQVPKTARSDDFAAAIFNGACPPWPGPALYWNPPPDGACPFPSDSTATLPEALLVSQHHPLVAGLPLQTLALKRVRHLHPRNGDRQLLGDSRGPLLLARDEPWHQAAVGFALGDSDLPLRVAFPLLVNRLVDWLAGPARQLPPPPLRVGDWLPLPLPPERVSVSTPQGRPWPEHRLGPGAGLRLNRSGWWRLQADDREELLAVNFFSASESDLHQRPQPGPRKWLVDSGRPPRQLAGWFADQQPAKPTILWPRLVLAGTWLLLLEWLAFCWRLLF